MNYSRRQLEAFGEPLGESVTRLKPGGRIYGGGGGGPTQTTVTQSNVPDWLRPQVETVLGGAMKELFQTKAVGGKPAVYDDSGNLIQAEVLPTYEITGTKPFTPYSTRMEDYVAGFSPLQQQVQANAANLQVPGQFGQATDLAGAAGMGGMQSAQQALGYGNAGFQSGQLGQQLGIAGGQRFGEMGAGYGQGAADIGLMGLRAEQYGRNISGQAEDYASQAAGIGDLYGQMATSPDVYEQYMSPYQQAVTDVQLAAAQRQADIARTQRSSRAARAGAFGGARQAIEEAEANRALASQLDAIQAQGLQSAFQQAQQNIQQRAALGLQGLSGAQQGLGTALQGGQLGLSGIGQAMQGQQLGMQGAGVGLQGLNAQLAGTAQGMQGAGVGLQGVGGAQAGYGLANQAASNLASIGRNQLDAQTGILSLQNQIGGQQQAQEQAKINQAISNYAQAQQSPMERMQQFNALLRGYAVPGQTTAQYQAAPSMVSQLAGLGTAGVGLAGMANMAGVGKKKGGKIDSGEGIDKLAMRRALAGA